MKVLFIGLLICLARFGPILVKNVLSVFAITVLFIMISSLYIKDFGKVFFSCVLERISFIVSHVFILFLDFIDCFYQYSSGVSPAVSGGFFPLQQPGLIGQRSSFCGQVFIYEASLVFVKAVECTL